MVVLVCFDMIKLSVGVKVKVTAQIRHQWWKNNGAKSGQTVCSFEKMKVETQSSRFDLEFEKKKN